MKVIALLLLALLAGCGFDQGDPAITGPGPDGTGSAELTLVSYNGQMVPACSVSYSRCKVGTAKNYEQCAWSVKNPGAEDWLQGSCDGTAVCQQQGLEARCVSAPAPASRTLECQDMGTHIRVHVIGPMLGGGLASDPTDPQYLEYGADITGETTGWVVPYPGATRRERERSNGTSNVILDLEPEVTAFNLYLTDMDSSTRNSWFRLDGNTWTVRGICEVRRDAIGNYKLYRTTALPGTPQPPPPPPPPQGIGTIVCKKTSSALVVSVRGPVLSRLVSPLTSPTRLEWGGNKPTTVWALDRLSANGRAFAAWTNDTDTYVLNLPLGATEFNLHVAGTSTNGWFHLYPRNGVYPWAVSGDCSLNADLIYRR